MLNPDKTDVKWAKKMLGIKSGCHLSSIYSIETTIDIYYKDLDGFEGLNMIPSDKKYKNNEMEYYKKYYLSEDKDTIIRRIEIVVGEFVDRYPEKINDFNSTGKIMIYDLLAMSEYDLDTSLCEEDPYYYDWYQDRSALRYAIWWMEANNKRAKRNVVNKVAKHCIKYIVDGDVIPGNEIPVYSCAICREYAPKKNKVKHASDCALIRMKECI